jgi:hypothetical protein
MDHSVHILIGSYAGLWKEKGRDHNENRGVHRKTLSKYSDEFLSQALFMASGMLILSYSLYTFFTKKTSGFLANYASVPLMATIPIASYMILRYLYLINRHNIGEEPEKVIIRDKGLLVGFIIWVLMTIVILYD